MPYKRRFIKLSILVVVIAVTLSLGFHGTTNRSKTNTDSY
jgi:hypothetical protein